MAEPSDGTTGKAIPGHHALLAVAALALAWLLFAWPWLRGGVTIPWDGNAQFAPQVQFMANSIAAGQWPFWNPFVYSGQVQIADPQSMLFSPLMLILALTDPAPDLWAIDTAALAMLFVAGCGALWLAFDRGWHWAGGLVAALGFAFGAAMAWRLQHFEQVFSMAYYPFAMVLLRRALERSSAVYGGLAAIVTALIVLSRNQVGLLCIYLLVGQVVGYWLDGPGRPARIIASLKPLAAGAIVGLALIALPIVMTLEHAQISNRPTIDYAGAAAASLHPALLVTALIPHLFAAAGPMAEYWGPPSLAWRGTGLFLAQNMGILYIGALPYVLLVLGLIRGDLVRREIVVFSVGFVFVTLYALGGYTPAFWVFYEILPGVDMFRRPADAVFVMGGLGALLAGYALHRLLTAPAEPFSRTQIAAAIVLAVLPFACAVVFAIHLDHVPKATVPLLAAAAWTAATAIVLALALWLKPIRPVLAGLLLTGLLAADLRSNNGPNGSTALPTADFAFLEPDANDPVMTALGQLVRSATNDTHRPRVELVGLGFHTPNASMTHRLENTLGYNPVRLKSYADATGAGDTSGLPEKRPTTPLFGSYDTPLARLLGLRFVATKVPLDVLSPTTPKGYLRLVRRTKDGTIYEIPDALPRVLFATRAQRADFAKLVHSGVWPPVDPSSTVLLEQPFPENAAPHRPGTARILSYRNTEVEVETDSPDGGWLVLNDLWHPWWQVDVNGRPAQLLRANVLFRAVAVPPGPARVRFVFRPIDGAIRGLFQPAPR
jgi:hypothetical protein